MESAYFDKRASRVEERVLHFPNQHAGSSPRGDSACWLWALAHDSPSPLQEETPAGTMLYEEGLKLQAVIEAMEYVSPQEVTDFSARSDTILRQFFLANNCSLLRTEHQLYALMEISDCRAVQLLRNVGVNTGMLKSRLRYALRSIGHTTESFEVAKQIRDWWRVVWKYGFPSRQSENALPSEVNRTTRFKEFFDAVRGVHRTFPNGLQGFVCFFESLGRPALIQDLSGQYETSEVKPLCQLAGDFCEFQLFKARSAYLPMEGHLAHLNQQDLELSRDVDSLVKSATQDTGFSE